MTVSPGRRAPLRQKQPERSRAAPGQPGDLDRLAVEPAHQEAADEGISVAEGEVYALDGGWLWQITRDHFVLLV